MFDQRAVGGGFAPEGVGKPAGRAKDLHGHVVAFPFWRADLRRIEIVRVTGIIQNQAVGFPRRQTQAAANNLLIQTDRFGRAQDSDQVDVRGVKAGGQHRHVNQIAELLGFKGLNQAVALGAGRLAGDERRVAGGQ